MKRENLLGMVFGNLTPIRHGTKNGRKTSWICLCSCGKETETLSEYLKSGHTKSCGCIKENFFQKRENIIGKKFGRLVVLENESEDFWSCQCDCGNIIYHIDGANLLNGNTKSCGCLQKERTSESSIKDLTGEKFGKLTVVKRAENNKFGHVVYFCECECGGVTLTSANRLKNGKTSSCGCIKSSGESKIQKILLYNNINFIPQFSLEDFKFSKSNKRGNFDFGVLDEDKKLAYLIEFDGKIHFSYTNYGWNTKESFEGRRKRDIEKNNYCFENNIPLIRIPYIKLPTLDIKDLRLETTSFLLSKENEEKYYSMEEAQEG